MTTRKQSYCKIGGKQSSCLTLSRGRRICSQCSYHETEDILICEKCGVDLIEEEEINLCTRCMKKIEFKEESSWMPTRT